MAKMSDKVRKSSGTTPPKMLLQAAKSLKGPKKIKKKGTK